MKTVSVVIRSIDRPLLRRAINSVADQSYPNIDVIVINALGPGHREIGPAISEKLKIRFIDSSVQLSRPRAANIALENVTTDLILFLDDDDTIEPDHIKALVETYEKNDCLAVFSNSTLVHPDNRTTYFTHDQELTLLDLIIANRMTIHSVIFSRALVEAGCRFNEELDFYEDWDFWLQVRLKTRFAHLVEPSAIYQISPTSEISSGSDEINKLRFTLIRKWLSQLPDKDMNTLVEKVRGLEELEHLLAHPENIAKTVNEHLIHESKVVETLKQANLEREQLEQQANFEREQLNHERNLLAEEIERIKKTLSWRITSPIRKVRGLAKIERIKKTLSWRITSPIRKVRGLAKKAIAYRNHFSDLLKNQGGATNSLKKILEIYQKEGFLGVRLRIFGLPNQDYDQWIQLYDTLNEDKIGRLMQRINALQKKPLISIVMPVYNPDLQWLKYAIQSIQDQIYPNWQLCIADDASNNPEAHTYLKHLAHEDPRIHVDFRASNGHISAATNTAIESASGDYIAFMDQDDALSQDALFWIANTINQTPNAALIYSDEDKINSRNERYDHYFKPDWNYDLLLSQNYLCHLSVYKNELISKLGGLRIGYEGAQDHDLALRAIEIIDSNQIAHIPRILYHWRSHAKSTALHSFTKPYAIKAGIKSIEDHLSRTNVSGHVEAEKEGHYRIHYSLPDAPPSVSIVIPTRNHLALLKKCIDSLLAKTDYPNFWVHIIDNNSNDEDCLHYLEEIKNHPRVSVSKDRRGFNFSALNNRAIQNIKEDFVVLMNNDIEVITPDWLSEMVSIGMQPGVGAVGARLWFPNNTLQHGGVVLIGGVAGHAHKYFPKDHPGYAKRAMMQQSFSAVTAAALLIKRSIYEEVGGLDEDHLAVAFNDVDFCLRLLENGYRNVWTPYAEFYHHESVSRGSDLTPEKQERFAREVEYMQERWGELLQNDPAYNPNLTASREDFSLAFPPRVDLLMR